MIILQFLLWYFLEVPKKILKAWGNFLRFNLEYFSIPLLLRTLFSHWRRYQWSYPRGFDLPKYLEVFFSNLISRLLGIILRIVLIFICLLGEILILVSGAIIFIGWFALPVLLWLSFGFGFKKLF
jgi:hypothetical protein